MTVLELNDLVKAIEEEFGVQLLLQLQPRAAAGGEAAEEQTEFDVVLTSLELLRLKLLKQYAKSLVLDLKMLKILVDNAPGAIKEGISKDEAEEMKV